MKKQIGIIGIHTGIGKTLAAAIICEALHGDYWKPIQAGDLSNSDSEFIRKHVSNPYTRVYQERYKFENSLSPHAAARLENISVSLSDFSLPESSNHLIIETAGGLHSPVNDQQTMLDLIIHLGVPDILVSKNYLGSINHSLLTIDVLRSKKIPILGILFNGDNVESSSSFISDYSNLSVLGRIPHTTNVDQKFISDCARDLESGFKVLLK